MITFKNVTKQFTDGTTAVDNMSFSIEKGEFFVLIGPSGCGKTTTLKMMNRLIPLSTGTILIDNKRISDYNIDELRWNIGYVLQQIALFPHMTIEENIAIVPEMKKWDRDDVKKRTNELLQMVGLDPDTYRDRQPHELSGGEQQRVGVIRALAADPDIILMDEPFSALDPISREKLQEDIIDLQQKINKTIVFVTHDIQEALKLADRICIMKEGKIVQLGSPKEILTNPVNDFVRDFIGSTNSIGATFHLNDMMQPASDGKPSMTIDASASLEEVLDMLSKEETIYVTSKGKTVGQVNRQTLVQYLSSSLKEGRGEYV
ncbi:ABC transporter ATP-binding protein [Gracilibacillus thailandensis]|jgi:osmoprotectant transport system ATP-binding protein|uniref:Quaternary amine transport ATP-binding protein n=1 Tax=Gracilibacillus thailandensis TaxID=563735 RepID=A0A6N7R0V4_9BACI|nr:ABC transporter ATP-binding protein [Gracilibacillus thailandensis]MRI66905.1 betaine/proline/choline family ABC transporter ATP-binding protein [Gracilibacillus thailandensis]